MYSDPKSLHPNWKHSQHLVLYHLPAWFQNLISLLTDTRWVDYYATISDESFCLVSSNQNQNTWFPCERNRLSIIMIFRMKDIRIFIASKIKIPIIVYEYIRFDIRINSPTHQQFIIDKCFPFGKDR